MLNPQTRPIPTGFSKLDMLLGGGLFQGTLTILGGLSGAGKTSLAVQIAKNISESGRDVLIFELEVDPQLLIQKTICMQSACLEVCERGILRDAIPLEYLRDPKHWDKLTEKQTELFSRACSSIKDNEHLYFICPKQPPTIDIIIKAVADFIKSKKPDSPPLVVIDYLQYIPAEHTAMTEKQAIDHTIKQIKTMISKIRTPVIALSSINRNSYGASPTQSAAKGSGEIEYTSDTLLFLNRQEKADNNLKPIENVVSNVVSLQKETMQLIALKNRSAATNTFCNLDFFSACSYFSEETPTKKVSRRR